MGGGAGPDCGAGSPQRHHHGVSCEQVPVCAIQAAKPPLTAARMTQKQKPGLPGSHGGGGSGVETLSSAATTPVAKATAPTHASTAAPRQVPRGAASIHRKTCMHQQPSARAAYPPLPRSASTPPLVETSRARVCERQLLRRLCRARHHELLWHLGEGRVARDAAAALTLC